MEKLTKVCAVIDAQGFKVNGQFHPREVAIISHTYKQSNLCETGLTYSMMSRKDRKTNGYISNQLLGLSLNGPTTKDKPFFTDDGEQMIVVLYEKVKTTKNVYVAIKNKEIKPILEKWNIPYIDLEDYGCPNMGLLKILYYSTYCHFHEREVPFEDRLICAAQKVDCLWRWLKDYIKRET